MEMIYIARSIATLAEMKTQHLMVKLMRSPQIKTEQSEGCDRTWKRTGFVIYWTEGDYEEEERLPSLYIWGRRMKAVVRMQPMPITTYCFFLVRGWLSFILETRIMLECWVLRENWLAQKEDRSLLEGKFPNDTCDFCSDDVGNEFYGFFKFESNHHRWIFLIRLIWMIFTTLLT